jgi:general stress protein 26
MATQELDDDGCLWFFTGLSSLKVDEVRAHHQVNLSYVKDDDNRYVSVSGSAELVMDREKMRSLWQLPMKAWFPDGVDDPDLALLRVHVEKAEYWDTVSSKLVQAVGFVKALVTGKRAEGGHHENVAFEPPRLH